MKTISLTALALGLLVNTINAASAPFATTLPVTGISGSSANLNGAVTPNDLPTTTWFQWGTNNAYGNQTPASSAGSGGNVSWVSAPITNLLASVAYHYRVAASNSLGVTYGADQLFGAGKKTSAWGYNGNSQTSVPAGITNAVAVADGGAHSLVLTALGAVIAWGDNYYGQATVPPGVSNALAIAGGYNDSLALLTNGSVAAWGDGSAGETNVPTTLSNVVAIAAGDEHCLALLSNGMVTGWGSDYFGESEAPEGLTNVVAIAAGGAHSLALLDSGTVVAWGDDFYGESDVPENLGNVVAISAGLHHSVALLANGTVAAWGDNSSGQTNIPQTATNLVSISAGRLHTLVQQESGKLLAWGDNTYGQTNIPAGVTNVAAYAAGGYHNSALSQASLPFAPSLTVYATSNGSPSSFTFNVTGYEYDNYPIQFFVTALPQVGYLFEPNIDTRITTNAPLGPVNYPGPYAYTGIGFNYPSVTFANPYATFQYTIRAGDYSSLPATVTVIVGQLPQVTNENVVSASSANTIVTGSICPGGLATTEFVQWGLTTAYGNSTSPVVLPPGTNFMSITNQLIGLAATTQYHYQIVATNGLGTVYGPDTLFQTPVAPYSINAARFLTNGTFRITFNASAGTTYSLWRSTNLVNWVPAGSSTEDLPGQYEAEDVKQTNSSQNFYQLRWP